MPYKMDFFVKEQKQKHNEQKNKHYLKKKQR
jgi:hypothetical protein